MGDWEQATSGSKRNSDFAGPHRSGGHSSPPAYPLNSSFSSEEYLSSQSPHGDRLPTSADEQPACAFRRGTTVSTQMEAPVQAWSRQFPLPRSTSPRTASYKLPPLSFSSYRQSSTYVASANPVHEIKDGEISTEALQLENRDLKSAYLQAQTHIADLNRRIHSSNEETGKLLKERQKLRAKVDILEAEVEELQNSIESSQRQNAAKDAQYSQIIDSSARLQTKSVMESRSQRSEREEWMFERERLQNMIMSLRLEMANLRQADGDSGAEVQHGTDGHSETCRNNEDNRSSDLARIHLPRIDMQSTFNGLRHEHGQLIDYIGKLEGIGQTIHNLLLDVATMGNLDSS